MNWTFGGGYTYYEFATCETCLLTSHNPTRIRGRRYCDSCIRKYKLLICECGRTYGEYRYADNRDRCGSCIRMDMFV